MTSTFTINMEALRGDGSAPAIGAVLELYCTWLDLQHLTLIEGRQRLEQWRIWLLAQGYPIAVIETYMDAISAHYRADLPVLSAYDHKSNDGEATPGAEPVGTYDRNLARLRGDCTDERRAAILALFCLWLEAKRLDLDQGLARIDEYAAWLIGWGYPRRAIEIHLQAILEAAAMGRPDDPGKLRPAI